MEDYNFYVPAKMRSCVPLPLLPLCSNEKMGGTQDNVCVFSVSNL